jgi:hypothetical protein
MLRRNCLLKHVVEGNVEGTTRRRRRRRRRRKEGEEGEWGEEE